MAEIRTHTGNLTVNDEGAKIFADDSTDSGGFARITIPSFSGCGTVSIRVFVSNSIVKTKVFTVRTTDSNADGRTTAADTTARCDLNYNGSTDAAERDTILHHLQDWHRNALFGTLVMRTSLCDTLCGNPPSQAGTMGEGDFPWSPSGRQIVFSIMDSLVHCKIFHTAADRSIHTVPQEFTWPPTPPTSDPDDYDPSWSPLGDQIFWVRNDQVIYRKGIPGIATDTTEAVVYDTQTQDTGCCEAISPDGRTIAFSRQASGPTYWNIWTVPATGGTARQITSLSPNLFRNWYPKWSPDGQTLIFQRITVSNNHRAIYTVSAFDSLAVPTPLYDVSGQAGESPSYAADGSIVVSGVGPHVDRLATTAHTLDVTGTPGFRPIGNYPGYTFGDIFPKMSPDGTRFALEPLSPSVPRASFAELWAVRRNMSLPPQFTAVGGQSVADSSARVFFTMLQGQAYQITLTASDPEADHLTYNAYYLQLGMAFDTTTRTFSWTPPSGTVGQTFNVKFGVTTPSGGADAIIALITVNSSLHPGGAAAQLAQGTVSAVSEGAGLVRFAFHGVTPKAAEVLVFDVAGRRLTRLQGHTGEALRWDGRDTSGRKVANGMYFYRVRTEGATFWGRLVYLR